MLLPNPPSRPTRPFVWTPKLYVMYAEDCFRMVIAPEIVIG